MLLISITIVSVVKRAEANLLCAFVSSREIGR